MKSIGSKVIIRDHAARDLLDESRWATDAETNRLDPSVGNPIDTHIYSVDAINGKHIGVCAVYDITPQDAQIGIRIGEKDYWNCGYGTDAIKLFTEYLFSQMSVNRVYLKVLPENIRAIRCYEKCDFIQYDMIELNNMIFILMELWRPKNEQ